MLLLLTSDEICLGQNNQTLGVLGRMLNQDCLENRYNQSDI